MRESFALEGTHVRLEPLDLGHVDDLVAAAVADRSTFGFTWVPDNRPAVPFATRSLALGRIVGSTRFYDIERWDWSATDGTRAAGDGGVDLVSIGHTWLGPAAQRTPVNSEAKLLMLDHAFDRWGVRAVRLQTDARNQRSRAAIARIGCSLDGVLRSDRPAADGSVRDSAVFSMLATEWPDARRRLAARLAG
jgi:N-acetyltransferase